MKGLIYFFAFFYISFYSIGQAETATYYIDKSGEQIAKNQYQEALKTLSEGIAELPDSVDLYDARGTLLEAMRRFDEAIVDFSNAIEKTDKNHVKSHLYSNRGGTKYRIRDFNGAYEDLKIAVKFDSLNIDALNNLAATCDEVNKPEESLIILEQIITIDSSYVPAYINLGFQYQKMNRHREAIGYFDKAEAFQPNAPLIYSNRSYSKLKLDDLKGAMRDINKSIKLFPTNSYAYKIRALIKIAKDDEEKACQDLDKAIELGYTQQYGEEVNELKAKYCK
jgi:tetratricopeptide (TPR) repeat protein